MARRPSSAIHSKSSTLAGLDLGVVVVDLLVGEQAGLDPLGQLDLLLGVEQRDLADLLQVVLDRVGGRAGGHHLLLGLVGVVGLGQGEALVLGQLALELGLLGRLEGRLVDVVQRALLADGEHDLFGLQVEHHVGGHDRDLDLDLVDLDHVDRVDLVNHRRPRGPRAPGPPAGLQVPAVAVWAAGSRRPSLAAPVSPPRSTALSDAFLAGVFVAGFFAGAAAGWRLIVDGAGRGIKFGGCHKDLSDHLAKLGHAEAHGCHRVAPDVF